MPKMNQNKFRLPLSTALGLPTNHQKAGFGYERYISTYFFDLVSCRLSFICPVELQQWSAFPALSFQSSWNKAVQKSGTGTGDVKSNEKSNGCPVMSNGTCQTKANVVVENGPSANEPPTPISDKKID
ncbi:hypothetical protein DPEC_G00332720 [Dallia pectoralis]|uniref:Uncharacterized protein n=1 Tax=Dallia pectoralis TaxID=75939 RepID=A0ACC2F691_DALPE|nr:hypothetical protein DPEC_G00332720 [Dallia pectoralis]